VVKHTHGVSVQIVHNSNYDTSGFRTRRFGNTNSYKAVTGVVQNLSTLVLYNVKGFLLYQSLMIRVVTDFGGMMTVRETPKY
jgi:hypothetical protein